MEIGKASEQARRRQNQFGIAARPEIAEELRAPLPLVRIKIDELRASGAIVTWKLTRYVGDRTIEALECRVSGYAPKPAPGRKAKKAA